MSPRLVAVLVVLLAVLGGGALLLQRQEAARKPEGGAALGEKVLKDLKAADVASIRIVEDKSTLTLRRKDDAWVITERRDFPADLATVREFVLKLIELKVGQSEPLGEKDRARLALDTAATQLELAGADGKPLARLAVGRKYFKREVEDPAKAAADGRFVQRPEQPGVALIVSDPLVQATARSGAWIDRTLLKIEKVASLEVRYPDGSGWRVERSGDNADWKLAGARPGEKLETTRANAATYVLGLLELADVLPDDPKPDPKSTGLDAPTVIRATTLAGASTVMRVGRLEGENYYVSVEPSSSEPRDRLLAGRVLLVPKSRLEDTLKKRDEMLAKKEDTKK